MADTYTIHLDDGAVLNRLNHIARSLTNMAPVMGAIGEVLVESTKQRFDTSTAPDGSRWAPNAPATVLARLAQISGAYSKKTGRMTKKGMTAAMSKKPLVASGELRDSIHWQVLNGGNAVQIGTNRFAGEWDGGAAVHQFGSRNGKIPARPFLGISTSDRSEVLDLLAEFVLDDQ